MEKFSRTIKIYFANKWSPNESMGNILIFYNSKKEKVAHLSLTWESNAWFGYYCNNKWIDLKFFTPFNAFQHTLMPDLQLDICIEGDVLIWKQNGIIQINKLDTAMEFDTCEYLSNFENNHCLTSIEKTKVEFCECELSTSTRMHKKTVDVIICGYLAFDYLKITLYSLLETYKHNSNNFVKINSIVYCDNNIGENKKQSQEILNEFKELARNEFDVVYIENDDKSYCSNRLTGFKKAFKYCNSNIITSIDSDIVFSTSDWINTYDYFDKVNADVVTFPLHYSGETPTIRHGRKMLPRLSPFFSHFKREKLEKYLQDETVLNDFDIESKYKNVKITQVGFHFSKLFFEIINNNDTIVSLGDHFHSNDVAHFMGGSFQELWSRELIESMRQKSISGFHDMRHRFPNNSYGSKIALNILKTTTIPSHYNFVIVSHAVNYWALGALRELILSIKQCKYDEAKYSIYVVHSMKTGEQIEHFKSFDFEKTDNINIIHLNAYEDVYINAQNPYDFGTDKSKYVHFYRHGMVLMWLIKYKLPAGSYLFIDHDCFVNRCFIEHYKNKVYCNLYDKLFVCQDHTKAPSFYSITAPMFYVNTEIRDYLNNICDMAWMPGIIWRIPIENRIITSSKFEKIIERDIYDDTMYNVVRKILFDNPCTEGRFDLYDWGYNEHMWGASSNLKSWDIDDEQLKLFNEYFLPRMDNVFFEKDRQTDNYLILQNNLKNKGVFI